MAADEMAAEAKLLALAQQQLHIERQLREMVEEESLNAQERFEHEQVYQKHCQDEVRRARAGVAHSAVCLAGRAAACARPWLPHGSRVAAAGVAAGRAPLERTGPGAAGRQRHQRGGSRHGAAPPPALLC